MFLSSGVSGGSVGLALGRKPAAGASAEERLAGPAAERLAEPAALAAAVDGLVVRDLLAAATGIRIHDRDHGTGGEWLDRAGLMEHRWESDAPRLAEPFLSEPGASGRLLLNSTSVGTACRMIVSDISLPGGVVDAGYTRRADATSVTREEDPDCHTPVAGLPAGSVDLLGAYDCLGPLSGATAAMLSARFPYVTPSGVVRGCPGDVATQQLVDGGYAEGSGLGALLDLAPELMRLVRSHNAEVIAGARTGPVVVPTVVFLQNHFGTDLSAPPSAASSELLVPPVARRAKTELGSDAAMRQRLEAMFAEAVPCPPPPPPCRRRSRGASRTARPPRRRACRRSCWWHRRRSRR